MQLKRNTVVVVNYKNKPRLALVRSLRKNNKVNVMIHLYRNASCSSDWLIDPSDIVCVTDVPAQQFDALAKSYPNYAATDRISLMLFANQAAADAQWPKYAAYRNNYGPYESPSQIMARLFAAA